MIAETEIFDIWRIVNNELIGDTWITVFLFAIGTIYLTIKFKMPFQSQLIFLILVLGLMFSKMLEAGLIIWIFIVMIVGGFFYWVMSKTFD